MNVPVGGTHKVEGESLKDLQIGTVEEIRIGQRHLTAMAKLTDKVWSFFPEQCGAFTGGQGSHSCKVDGEHQSLEATCFRDGSSILCGGIEKRSYGRTVQDFEDDVDTVPIDVGKRFYLRAGRVQPSQVSGLNVAAEDEEAVHQALFVGFMSGWRAGAGLGRIWFFIGFRLVEQLSEAFNLRQSEHWDSEKKRKGQRRGVPLC